jgi:formylglycine-generating enzyme required for sulfatase activity/pimeloyl-ACP methyl ester carboxylesterase
VTVEIPPNALSSAATFTLKSLGYNLEDSLDVRAEMISQPVSMTIGTADITDTIYVLLPSFDKSDIWNVVGFKVGGVWYPLSVIEQDATHTRVAIPPELFGPGKFGLGVAKGIETVPGYVIAGMNLLIPNPSNVSLSPPGSQLNTPAIVLIHGIFSDSKRWESILTDSLSCLGAEVYYLDYSWENHFMDVAPYVIATLKQQLGNRDIYFVCQSKGGLLARAIIRLNETENSGLSLRRALFLDTPHFGVFWITALENYLQMLFLPTEFRLLLKAAKECEGIAELESGSSELAAIAQPLSFADRPLYKCIIAVDGLIGVVSASSADLALPKHNGERENAVYCSTDSTECSHDDMYKYNEDSWPEIKEFLSVEDPGPSGDFVRIPAGTFTMGSPTNEYGRGSDETQHTVTLTTPFLMSATEVTNQQYADMAQWAYDRGYCSVTSSIIHDNMDGSTHKLLDLNADHGNCEISFSNGTFTVDSGKETHPVKEVEWYGAVAYCDWLSLRRGLPRAYDHATWQCNGNDPYNATGYRLPTEAEWEYACRAGTQTPFNTGSCLDAGTQANYNGNKPYASCSSGPYVGWSMPVGSYPDNTYGLYDMHGNLWEWCNDRYGSYNGDETDPTGPTAGLYRVFRGGEWFNYGSDCRSADRYTIYPVSSYNGIGFRPVKSAN